MVRAYDPKPVPRDTLERIAGTVRRAPSAGFSQGQRLIVVTDAARRKAIAEASGEEFYVDQGFPPWISGAAALVVVCTREDDYHDRYRQPDKVVDGDEIEWPVPYWHADAGAAAMLVLLAAIDEGLGAGVFGVPVESMQDVRALLELPDDIAIVEVITLGYAGGGHVPRTGCRAAARVLASRSTSSCAGRPTARAYGASRPAAAGGIRDSRRPRCTSSTDAV